MRWKDPRQKKKKLVASFEGTKAWFIPAFPASRTSKMKRAEKGHRSPLPTPPILTHTPRPMPPVPIRGAIFGGFLDGGFLLAQKRRGSLGRKVHDASPFLWGTDSMWELCHLPTVSHPAKTERKGDHLLQPSLKKNRPKAEIDKSSKARFWPTEVNPDRQPPQSYPKPPAPQPGCATAVPPPELPRHVRAKGSARSPGKKGGGGS